MSDAVVNDAASTQRAVDQITLRIERMRLSVHEPDVDVASLSDAEVLTKMKAIRDHRDAHPLWLHRPRADFGDMTSVEAVTQTATWLTESAAFLADNTPLGVAIYDVLVNAAGHVPDFGTIGGMPAPEPYGCTSCTGDGANACDTWETGIALAEAMLSQVAHLDSERAGR